MFNLQNRARFSTWGHRISCSGIWVFLGVSKSKMFQIFDAEGKNT